MQNFSVHRGENKPTQGVKLECRKEKKKKSERNW